MRRFHSYGPVNSRAHFCVPRTELVAACAEQLVGRPEEEGGHYFTLWAPRQTGKTWLMRQAKAEIERRWPERFLVATMSVQGVVMEESDPAAAFLERVPRLIWEALDLDLPAPPADWESFTALFLRERGLFTRPLVLFIDEFDSLPRQVIDQLVVLFRDISLKRQSYLLHGLALIGVRAVLGVESQRGSPFNVQRSVHVPNFTKDEVSELFCQYQEESEQAVQPQVVKEVHRVTRGQPGLVGWFGELLTETHNPGRDQPLDGAVWEDVYRIALTREWNNTVLNLVKKARGEYQPRVVELFGRSDLPFRLDADWCNYLYLNGILDYETVADERGTKTDVCRFSSPFIQERLYNALIDDLVGDRLPILALEPLDDLADVFDGDALDLPALLQRYRAYLARLTARGIDPWKEQPRRSDLRLTEAVGHFHLYAWLQEAVGRRCVASPEFPTGNGKVDLHLRCGDRRGIIEVKSFVDAYGLDLSRRQAARYATSVGLDTVTLALFVPSKDDEVLRQLSGETEVDGVRVVVVAIGWAPE
jgi:hypothetical protein